MKKVVTLVLSLIVMSALFACSGGQASSTEPLDLQGDWRQVDTKTADNWVEATITGDTIEVFVVNENGERRSLQWAGTYRAPTEATNSYTWESERDSSRTEISGLASSEDTKVFTYENGKLSYKDTIGQITLSMTLERI